ncbi:MAG TPA: dihydrofolate reductase family protein [Actinomycetota bacterium]|nr:dihydrofolate reductase family protein [Actinomycetota bacterium]
MAKLTYTSLASLDGYIADANGNFDWAEPDDEVHAFVNDIDRSVGTYLLGRRTYEVLAVWDTIQDDHPAIADFADIWRSTDKIVYSSTLESVTTARTRLERTFDPDAVAGMKASSDRDLSIGGPTLAARAIAAGLVDEWNLFLSPVVVGGGTSAFPAGSSVELTLEDERRFSNGTVYLRYRTGR